MSLKALNYIHTNLKAIKFKRIEKAFSQTGESVFKITLNIYNFRGYY